MEIDYDHFAFCPSLTGAKAALPHVFGNRSPKSLLDVGCGLGAWVRAAIDYGITDVWGIDGIEIGDEHLLFPRAFFQQQDLRQRWDLNRQFDIILCLEVAEHLPRESAETLVKSVVAHSNLVVFSGACPEQIGRHHVNCQWPEYWQRLFNAEGYVCDDSIRWKIWSIESLEPWYRQNIFMASRAPDRAGQEPRICPVIHPQIFADKVFDIVEDIIESGQKPIKWYFTTPIKACATKFMRRLGRAVRSSR